MASRACAKCKKSCIYRDVGFKNVSLYCMDNCAADYKRECDEIATDEFRHFVENLSNSSTSNLPAVKGILTQAQCILNVADNLTVNI